MWEKTLVPLLNFPPFLSITASNEVSAGDGHGCRQLGPRVAVRSGGKELVVVLEVENAIAAVTSAFVQDAEFLKL